MRQFVSLKSARSSSVTECGAEQKNVPSVSERACVFPAPAAVPPGPEPFQSRRQLNQEQTRRFTQTRHQRHALVALPAHRGESACLKPVACWTRSALRQQILVFHPFSSAAPVSHRGREETDRHSDKSDASASQQLVSVDVKQCHAVERTSWELRVGCPV